MLAIDKVTGRVVRVIFKTTGTICEIAIRKPDGTTVSVSPSQLTPL